MLIWNTQLGYDVINDTNTMRWRWANDEPTTSHWINRFEAVAFVINTIYKNNTMRISVIVFLLCQETRQKMIQGNVSSKITNQFNPNRFNVESDEQQIYFMPIHLICMKWNEKRWKEMSFTVWNCDFHPKISSIS